MKYPAVGYCIYCGSQSTSLREEHIIPFALNGALILPEASCKQCEKETHSYEYTVCRRTFGNFRMRYNIRSRRKNKRPSHIEIGVINQDGNRGKASIPVAKHPVVLFMYKFEESDYLKGNKEEESKFNWVPISIFSRSELDDFIKKYNWDKELQILTVPIQFARMLAKIAYSYVVAEVGLNYFIPFELIKNVILNKSDNISYLVGGDWEIPKPDPVGNHLLRMVYKVRNNSADIIVEIRLFPAFETPLYRVVVGKIDFTNAVHKEGFEMKIKSAQSISIGKS